MTQLLQHAAKMQQLLRRNGLVLAGFVVLVTGCGRTGESPSTATPSASVSATPSAVAEAEPSPSVAEPSPETSDSTLISPEGISSARLGMTLGELKSILGSETEFTVESPFIVDFDAIAVRRNDETLYHILYLAGETFGDDDVIQGLYTDNRRFRTAEGIGPGTPLTEAEQAYGEATLSYNTQNESREYARFERQPASNVSFATGNGNDNPAGVYASSNDDYNETTEYRSDATIQSVLVICLTEGCAPTATN
jgi:hypothetical protein